MPACLNSDFTHNIYLNLKTVNIRDKFWFLEAHERIYMGSIQSKSDTQLNPWHSSKKRKLIS